MGGLKEKYFYFIPSEFTFQSSIFFTNPDLFRYTVSMHTEACLIFLRPDFCVVRKEMHIFASRKIEIKFFKIEKS